MSKTIKQIADELGVSKQAVHQKRKGKAMSTALQPFTSTVDGVVYIEEQGVTLLREAFGVQERKPVDDNLSSTVDGAVYGELMAVLKEQLAAKDRQIAAQQEQIAQLTSALENTTASLQAAQALHAGTIQKQLTDGSSRKWWQKRKKED